jgi:hypothetical protein
MNPRYQSPEPLLELWWETGSGGADTRVDIAGPSWLGMLAGLTSRLKL